ncbi:MAG: hydantoinase B/oxoprolinase family protein [Pseudomonadota bacterium]
MSRLQVGVDVGGTFTDLIVHDLDTDELQIRKVPTTPADQANGFIAALEAADIDMRQVESLVHGSTIGTNAVLERKGVKLGLITTRGFRDVLELGRRTRPHAWGLTGTFEPLVSRERRREVNERLDADGNVLVALDEAEVELAIRELLTLGIDALVISFMHAYANPTHERRAGVIAKGLWPQGFVTLGSDAMREIREFERSSAAALNGYIQPLMSRYLGRLSETFARNGLAPPLLVMQGNGGMMSAGLAADQAVQTVMSGPAAGAVAAARIAREAGFNRILACDMGGTSFDLTLINDGEPAITTEKDMAYGVPLHVPMVDIHTIGAGGGSIARIDASGLLQVGPDSAGADPGPIAYARGGRDPTVTDANLILGRIGPNGITGRQTADLEAIKQRVQETIGEPLGLDAIDAAAAILAVANNQMANAARMVSVEKGHDPRDFALFAFGGGGPLHAVEIARELGMLNVLVPRYPGITSAIGCVISDVRHNYVRSIQQPLLDCDAAALVSILAEHDEAGRKLIESEGVSVSRIDVIHEADLLYRGQSHVFRVPIGDGALNIERLNQEFAARYRERFEIALPEMVPVLVNLRTQVIGRRPSSIVSDVTAANSSPAHPTAPPTPTGRRQAWFDGQWCDTAVYRRDDLVAGMELNGPLIIEQIDTTLPVGPGITVHVDPSLNLIIPVSASAHDAAPIAKPNDIDPVTLAVVQSGLNQIASEMDLVHQKTSFSPIISEAYDRSNGIYDREDGKIIAQGELGLPIFLGVMQEATRCVIERRDDLSPGDVIIMNDPYLGGTHLMDVKLVRPFFYRGTLWAYLSNTGHWSDTGGMVPGGFAATATEIQQEGLRLPPVKVMSNGAMVDDVVDIVLSNVRVPEERLGDLRAQLGALVVGEQRLTALIDRYGAQTVTAVIDEMRQRSERRMRAHIGAIPDGQYEFMTYVDSDGITDDLLTIGIRVEVNDTDLHVNLDNSSPPCRGPLNSVWATTLGAVLCGIKHIYPDVPINSGCFAPIDVAPPHGTFLFAEYPRPVSGCAAEVSQRIMEALFGALSTAVPNRMFGAPAGTSGNFSLGGFDPKTGRNYVMYIFSGGGYGGFNGGDGISNGCSSIGISKTQPVEVLEQQFPVLFDEYALREGSAGAGTWRGGFGISYKVRVRRGEAKASFMMDHGRTAPFGMLGGEPGAMNDIEVRIGNRSERPAFGSKGDGFQLGADDWVHVLTPGGGGYGDPANRDADRIEADDACGYFDTGR